MICNSTLTNTSNTSLLIYTAPEPIRVFFYTPYGPETLSFLYLILPQRAANIKWFIIVDHHESPVLDNSQKLKSNPCKVPSDKTISLTYFYVYRHFKVNSKFQIPNSKFQIPIFKFRIPNSNFQIPIFKFLIPNSEFRIPNSKFQIPNSEFRIPHSKFRIPNSNFQFPIPNSAFQIPNSKFQISNFKFQISNPNF